MSPLASKTRRPLRLLASAAPAALALAATPAFADTTVSTSTTTPLKTSDAGTVTVAAGGTIKLDGGTAVTVDAAKDVTVAKDGKLDIGAANGAAGIVVQGVDANISNAGTIQVLETFTPADADKNGVADGPVAQATGRYGIRIAPGGTVKGTISNTGTISIDGLNSAGIAADSTLDGSLTSTGSIIVKGDGSAGIRTGAVTGTVTAGGTVAVLGAGAQALVVGGDVGGKVLINGSLSQANSYTADDGTTQTLSFDALNTGKAAVEIGGNVAGGVLVRAPSSSSDSDTSRGTIGSVGASPALLIGGATDTTIGGGTTNAGTYSLGIDGTVTSSAIYSRTDSSAVVIGGRGGNVTLTKGIGVTGSITATTVDSSANGILINAGSTVGTLYNSGSIKAVVSQQGFGPSSAIKDLSGTLTAIENTGDIAVSGTSNARLAAIDVSANTSGVTIKQDLNSTDAASQTTDKGKSDYDPDTATVYTSIVGNIYTGSGADTVDIESGKVTGSAFLGDGADTVKLADDAKWVGNIDFGTGTATMTMAGNSRFTGSLLLNGSAGSLTLADKAIYLGTVTGGQQLAVTVNGGTFGANDTSTTTIGSLNVGANGTLRVYIDGTTGTASKLVATDATFAAGSKIAATITSLAKAEGTYTVLSAGTLNGASNIGSSALNMPVLYKGTISATGNDVQLTVARKSATELGLTAPQAAAYGAILANAGTDTLLQKSLLQVADVAALQTQFNQLLPNYSPGAFDLLTQGARLSARHIDDDSSWFTISEAGGWLEPIYFRNKRDGAGDQSYTNSGGGFSAGFEKRTGIGNLGLSFTYFQGDSKQGSAQKVKATDYELGLFWRKAAGPLYAYARLGVGRPSFTSTRTFTGTADGTAFGYAAAGRWKGWTISGTGGVSYAFDLGGNIKIKPRGVLEYFRLKENGYTETGNTQIALALGSRTSEVLNGTATLAASWSAGPSDYEGRPFTVEIEGGRRNRLSGHVGATTATFGSTGATSFTLTPDDLPSAWVGQLSLIQGGLDYTWRLSGGAEKVEGGGTAYTARASLSIAL